MSSTVSVVIAACNEAKTIGTLVRRLLRWRRKPEIIVVANGCQDGTARIAKSAGARVIRFTRPLGPDVGRAIGLGVARGDTLVVIDGDFIISPEKLDPFVRAVESGRLDIALNRYPTISNPRFQHPTAVAKHALNLFAGRPDLLASSLSTVPHAISRRALETLGSSAFCVPPVAQVKALSAQLRVGMATHVPVGSENRYRGKAHQRQMRNLMIGDCLEAAAYLIEERGVRGGFTDLNRKRELLQSIPIPSKSRAGTVAVVPTQGEPHLRQLIDVFDRLNVDEVRVVLNGAESHPDDMSSELVKVNYFQDPLGHDVGRAVGCQHVVSEKYFFTDADIPLSTTDIRPFLDAMDEGVDVALNRLDDILPKTKQTDAPSIVKRFLNLVCGRPDLGVASLTAVPHGISKFGLERIGVDRLAIPPVAQVEAILTGLRVEAVHPVDVIRTNAKRPLLHSVEAGRPMQKLIIGDYLEAISHLQAARGVRAGFVDDLRRRGAVGRYEAKRLKTGPWRPSRKRVSP